MLSRQITELIEQLGDVSRGVSFDARSAKALVRLPRAYAMDAEILELGINPTEVPDSSIMGQARIAAGEDDTVVPFPSSAIVRRVPIGNGGAP